jgi:hypothetical protein
VRHHLDLLKDRRLTQRRYLGSTALRDLEQLRRWDLGGRNPRARVPSLDDALDRLFAGDPDELRDVDGTYDPGRP